MPDTEVREVSAYAERRGFSLAQFVQNYLERMAELARYERESSAESAYRYLMSQDNGGVESDWHFSRDEANER